MESINGKKVCICALHPDSFWARTMSFDIHNATGIVVAEYISGRPGWRDIVLKNMQLANGASLPGCVLGDRLTITACRVKVVSDE